MHSNRKFKYVKRFGWGWGWGWGHRQRRDEVRNCCGIELNSISIIVFILNSKVKVGEVGFGDFSLYI